MDEMIRVFAPFLYGVVFGAVVGVVCAFLREHGRKEKRNDTKSP